MRLKSFYAKTLKEAMQMVRDTLGEDAIIVSSREERGGNIHVTAAIEPGYEQDYGHGSNAPAFEIGAEDGDNGWLQYDNEDEESAVIEDITDSMLRHGVSEDVLDHIISCATVIGFEEPGVALVAALEHLFTFKPLPQNAQNKPIMFVGPPGAGKTLAVAKLAARGVMDGLKVATITTDAVRAGGAEQLSAFTKLLRINLKKAENPKELRSIIDGLDEFDQIIIDTPGINPFEKQDIKHAAMMIDAAHAEPILALPAGIDTQESGEIARSFATIGTNLIMPTRTDISRRYGGLLSAAHHGSLSFTDASNTSKVADGLQGMTPQTLARMLMPHSATANRHTRTSSKTPKRRSS